MRTPIDYYHGRQVTGVIQGDEDWDWGIQLEGDVLIRNTDQRRTVAPSVDEIKDMALLSSSEDESGTDLDFGYVSAGQVTTVSGVSLTASKYRVAGPEITPASAQDETDIEDDPLPPDPSPERVVDHPAGGSLSAQEVTDAS